MFNNLVNLHDFIVLYEKVQRGGIRRVSSKLTKSNERESGSRGLIHRDPHQVGGIFPKSIGDGIY